MDTGDWMDWRAALDPLSLPLRRRLANLTAPDPATLGHPLFSERIKDRLRRWRDLKEPNPYSAIASKVAGQDYMRALGYAVPEVYGIYPSLEALPRFADLPPSFVVKPTNGWFGAGVYLMRDGVELISQRRLTRDDLIRTARSITGPRSKAIDGPWIAEELLDNFDAPETAAHDYKFYCFGPKVVLIRVNQRTGKAQPFYRYWNLDPDWNPLPFRLRWKNYPQSSPVTRPPFLDEMCAIASDVGARLNIFIRIDMFATTRGPVFCEFTGYPSSGNGFTPRGDAWLGSFWKTRDGGI